VTPAKRGIGAVVAKVYGMELLANANALSVKTETAKQRKIRKESMQFE